MKSCKSKIYNLKYSPIKNKNFIYPEFFQKFQYCKDLLNNLEQNCKNKYY